MKKKLAFGILVLLIIGVIGAVAITVMVDKSSFDHPEPELTEENLIDNPEMYDLIVNQRISPNGNNLTRMVLDEDDPNIMDEPWKFAFYVCTEEEHQAWILYYSGGGSSEPKLYGPFDWCFI